MNRIDQLFLEKQTEVLSIYFTAGFPDLEDTVPIIRALDKAGADLIEIGMPYSDPMADGPTIQESGSRALSNGITLSLLFDQLKDIRDKTDIPLLLMGYLNQMMQYGVDRFIKQCVSVGIDGLIIPDLPLDIYENELQTKLNAAGLHTVFLVTPQTSDARFHRIDQLSKGFVYIVSNASITGAKAGVSEDQILYFKRVEKLNLQNPRLIGFGISNHKSFMQAANHSNGVIIGSAFIKMLMQNKDSLEEGIKRFVKSIRSA